jgi:hypothetical protein
VRDGMAIYLAGLLLATAGIELMLALFLAVQGRLPAPSTEFLGIYAVVDLILFGFGGILVWQGWFRLREGDRSPPPEVAVLQPPTG